MVSIVSFGADICMIWLAGTSFFSFTRLFYGPGSFIFEITVA